MKFVLFLLFYFQGFFMAIIACSAIGFALCAIVALFKSVTRPKNLLLFLAYVLGSLVCYMLFLGGLYLAGWIGDRTNYAGQTGMLIGAIFPGLFCLAIIPQFLAVAVRQTSGIRVE
jgi:hypothetical protein